VCCRITLDAQIGEGAFGRVWKGVATDLRTDPTAPSPVTVAVKMLKEDATEQELDDLIQVLAPSGFFHLLGQGSTLRTVRLPGTTKSD
jgi:serine/threonine protein kinase